MTRLLPKETRAHYTLEWMDTPDAPYEVPVIYEKVAHIGPKCIFLDGGRTRLNDDKRVSWTAEDAYARELRKWRLEIESATAKITRAHERIAKLEAANEALVASPRKSRTR